MKGSVVSAILVILGCQSTRRQVPGIPSRNDVHRRDTFFDCDAPAGHLVEWSRGVQPSGSVRGWVFIAEILHDDHSAQFGRVAVAGPDGGRLGIDVTIDNSATWLIAKVRYPGHTAIAQALRREIARGPARGIPFALEWEANMVRMRIDPGGEWINIPSPFAPDRLVLECATGEAVFHSVVISTPL